MALALLVRSSCRNSVPVMRNLIRPSSTFAIRPIISKELTTKPVQSLIKSNIRPIRTTAVCKSGHSDAHVYIWYGERVLALSALTLFPLAFVYPSQLVEAMAVTSMVIHTHWGLDAIITDYVRAVVFGPLVPKVTRAAVFALSCITLGGLYYFIYTDIGIAKGAKKLWTLGKSH